MIHQELSLIGSMGVADNIFLGRTPTRAGFVRQAQQVAGARHWVEQLGLDLDVRQPVEHFPVAVQQLIEIAKALSQDARVIVMDEPTSALNAPEVEKLFALVQALKQRGCGIVYITHKMEEIERIADRITVLRDGRLHRHRAGARLAGVEADRVDGRAASWANSFPDAALIRAPNGCASRTSVCFPPATPPNRSWRAPRSRFVRERFWGWAACRARGRANSSWACLAPTVGPTRGQVWLDGQPIRFSSPRQAIESGVALLTNDRKATGLVLSLSIIANSTLAGLRQLSPAGWRRPGRERTATEQTTTPMRLRAASLELEVGALSGGNQQKVALAKWLQTRPRLLLLDEPTRGIDIAAKREIYQLMDQWTAQGIAIVLITSEMPELLTLSDRIIVMHRGKITAQFTRAQANPEAVLAAAMGRAGSSSPLQNA